MKILILFLIGSFLLVADSIRVDLTVTFHNLTLEQAAELESKIDAEFGDYGYEFSVSDGDKQNFFLYDYSWQADSVAFDTSNSIMWDTLTNEWK